VNRRPRLDATAGPRDLGRRARVAAEWRTPVGGRAPRLGPREYIRPATSRVGRFTRVDPLATPRLWNRWRWLGLVFWGGLTGEALRRAWRRHGGPTGSPEGE
jgi:hypothetical protein